MHNRGLQAILRVEPSFTWSACSAASSGPYTHNVIPSTYSSIRNAIPSIHTMQTLVGPSGVSALPAFPTAHRPTPRPSGILSHASATTSQSTIRGTRQAQRGGYRWSSKHSTMSMGLNHPNDASAATGRSSRSVATQAFITNECMANEYDAAQNTEFWSTRPVPVAARCIKIGAWQQPWLMCPYAAPVLYDCSLS
jgi:hypothetical protein